MPIDSTPNRALKLLEILSLERIELNLFRGNHEAKTGNNRLFGGQVLSQALAAASQTVEEDRACHSLHGYFLRPGRLDVPVIYRVDRIRDGKSFTTRRIVGIQKGEAIFSMDVSFHIREAGLQHQMDMQDIPGPTELKDDIEFARQSGEDNFWALRERPFEMRSVSQLGETKSSGVAANTNPVWLRFREIPENKQQVQQQLLAYASDMSFISTSYLPHRRDVKRDKIQMASLDHALWFHHDVDVNNWLVYIKDSTNAAMSRGFNRGSFYTRDGKLIASSMQEGLMRVRQ